MKIGSLFKKSNFPYEFEAENGSFTFKREYCVEEGIFFKVFGIALRKLHATGTMLEEYDIPKQYHARLLKSTNYAFQKAINEVKKDHPAFFVLMKQLKKATIIKKNKKVYLTITITGYCSGDE